MIDHGPGSRNEGTSGHSELGAAFQFGVAIVFFALIGRWLDGKFGTSPLLLLLGMLVGGAGGFYGMYRKLTAGEKRPGAKGPRHRGRGVGGDR